MPPIKLILLAVVCNAIATLFIATIVVANPQEPDALGSNDPNDNVRIESGVAINFDGIRTYFVVSLVDENGFRYDTWSSLRIPSIRNAAEITDEQMVEMQSGYGAILQKVSNLSLFLENEGNSAELKQAFRDLESEARNVMSPEQISQFDQARHFHALKEIGLAKYLSSSHFDSNISPADQAKLESIESNYQASIKAKTSSAIEQANQLLIKELNKTQIESFEKLLGDQKDEWMKLPLFQSQPRNSKPKPKKLARPDFVRKIALSTTIRKSLELTTEQFDEIKELKEETSGSREDERAERERQIREILTDKQLQKINSITILKEATRVGTVNALSQGWASHLLELSAEESDQIFKKGVNVDQGLQTELANVETVTLRESLNELSRESRDKFSKIFR